MSHIVKAYDQDIAKVQTRVQLMMQTCIEWTEKSCGALADLNTPLARDVLADHLPVESLRREIVGLTTLVMIRRAPLALDYRILATAREMAVEVTHICECARRIAQTINLLSSTSAVWPLDFGFAPMAGLVVDQVRLILNAYSALDTSKITQAWDIQNQVETADGEISRRIEQFVDSHPGTARVGAGLIRCAHDLHIITTHGIRLAEAVIFRVDGTFHSELTLLPDTYVEINRKSLLGRTDIDGPH